MNTDKFIVFLSTWATVSISFLVLSFLLRNQLVLGTIFISGYVTAVVLSFFVTIFGLVSPSLLKSIEPKIKDDRFMIILTAAGLSPFFWIVKRFALYTGLGISNNIFIILIALLLSATAFYGLKYSSFYLSKIQ